METHKVYSSGLSGTAFKTSLEEWKLSSMFTVFISTELLKLP